MLSPSNAFIKTPKISHYFFTVHTFIIFKEIKIIVLSIRKSTIMITKDSLECNYQRIRHAYLSYIHIHNNDFVANINNFSVSTLPKSYPEHSYKNRFLIAYAFPCSVKFSYFYKGDSSKALVLGEVEDVVNKFNDLDSMLKRVFSKVDPLLVVSLIFDRSASGKSIYTLETILKEGLDTEAVRNNVIRKTGMAPAFYLRGTKMIVSHPLDLEFLKWINDQEGIVSIKGSKFSAGGSSDF